MGHILPPGFIVAAATFSDPHPAMILPFVAMLLAIAVMPFVHKDWWEHHYPKVAVALGAIAVGYYLLVLHNGGRMLSVAHEYISFIALIGSLFVVSGGIHIRVKGEAKPWVNCLYLLIGAVLANVIGTTGASLLLIRPWIRMHKDRVTAFHIVFFIFIVSNVGGCLTPVGDPPLFLGYIKGVAFFWVAEHCWPMWLVANAVLLLMFYLVDRKNYVRAPKAVRASVAEPPDVWRFEGVPNLLF